MPARNWASPPKNMANGNRNCGEPLVPYQPARLAATMKVAPANPYRPRIEGAATGWSTTRVGTPSRAGSGAPLTDPPSCVWRSERATATTPFLALRFHFTGHMTHDEAPKQHQQNRLPPRRTAVP